MKNSHIHSGVFTKDMLHAIGWVEEDLKGFIKSTLGLNKKSFKYLGNPFDLPPVYENALFKDERQFNLFKGGRGSAKTVSLMIKLFDMSFDPKYTDKLFLCIREIEKTSDDSTRSELIKLINKKGHPYKDAFYVPKNGTIINLITGVQFVFIGGKDNVGEATSVTSRFNSLAKVKGKTAIGAMLLEEASAFTKDFLTMLFNTARPTTVFLKPEFDNSDGKDLNSIKDPIARQIVLNERKQKRVLENRDVGLIKVFAAMNPLLVRDPIVRYFDVLDNSKKHVLHVNIDDLPREYQSEELLNRRDEQRGDKDWDHNWKGMPKILGGGKLFNPEWIKRIDLYEDPENPIVLKWDKTIISVDPALKAKKESDETGIMVIGVLGQHYYIIDDKSGKYSSRKWSELVIELYDRYDCDFVVIETNAGGDSFVQIIEDAAEEHLPDPIYVRVISTNASGKKHKRAEAISPLYESGKVFHLKYFEKMEEQMDGFTTDGYIGQYKSPDRFDAVVWGLQILHYHRHEMEATYIGCF